MSITTAAFPSHLIPPSEKGREWILQYCKAAWSNFESDTPRNIFYHNRFNYEQYKQYAHGNQSINKYKPLLGVDQESDETYLTIDWNVIPIVPKFRRIALGMLNKVDYNIVATPVDSLANEEVEDYFAEAKAKILIREQAKQIDPSLLNSPALQLSPKEAKDLEELEIQMNYTYKHQMAIEAEQGIKLVLEMNGIDKMRQDIKECLFDFGVAGYKEYIDNNGAIKIRTVNPRNLITNFCRKKDFSDADYIGEVIEMSISDLKQMAGAQFTEEEYQEIAKNYIGLLGNPQHWPTSYSIYNKGYDKFKIRIMDIEFFSVNEMVYESRIDRRGNKIYARARFEDRNKKKDKFERLAYKVVYKGMWIINTNYLFNYGLATDMKRAKSSLMDTTMSYHLFAPEFWDMRAYGMMEQLIPIADAIQIAWYKLQNAIAEARPRGIMIEMGTLEDIPLGAGGKKLSPMKVLDLYNQKGTLVYRKADAQGRMTNYKPIEELENGLGKDVMNYWQIIQNNIQMIRDITGMNEFTDGSTPDPRALTTVAKLASEGTNNSLANIIDGDRKLLESLSNAIILRLQDVVERGEFKGYLKSLGSNTLKFIKVNPKLPLYEFGIFVEDKPTDEQRAQLMAQVQAGSANGLLDIEDAVIIQNTDNLKVAQQLLAYKIKKRKEEEEAKAIRMQQLNAETQQQSAIVAEQAKQQTIQIEGQVKSQIEQLKLQGLMEIEKLKGEIQIQLEQLRQTGKIATKDLENKGKKSVTKLKMGQPDDEQDLPTPPPIMEEEEIEPDETEQQYTELQGEGEEELANEELQ